MSWSLIADLPVTLPAAEGNGVPVVRIRNGELAAVPLSRHEFHGEGNYTITPAHAT